MNDTTLAVEPAAAPAPPGSRSLVVAGVWVLAAAALLWFVAIQVHPGSTEGLIVAAILGISILLTLLLIPADRLGRSAKVVVPLVVGAVAIGLWNPWHLSAVSLLFSHPFIGLLTVTGLTVRVAIQKQRNGTASWLTGLVVGVSIAAVVIGLVAAAVSFGFVVPGSYSEYYTRGPEDGLRLDQHDVSENGRCRAVVLRSGSGFTMRERVLVSSCYPDVELVNDHLVAETCDTSPARVTRLTAFDPSTLDYLGQTDIGDCRS